MAAIQWHVPAPPAPALLKRSLTQQVLQPADREALALEMRNWKDRPAAAPGPAPDPPYSAAGLWRLPHGPSFHRQLQLMAAQGMSPAEILRQATAGAAARLNAPQLGRIRAGADADLLLVDGNPLEDIAATERIVAVFFKGERVSRSTLLEDE